MGRPSRLAVEGFERVRRGRKAVLVCLLARNYPGREHERCPFHVVISEPGDERQEARGRELADAHRTGWHGGMSGDVLAQAVKGQLERSGEIGRR